MIRLLLVAAAWATVSTAAANTPVRPWENRTIVRVDVRGNQAVPAAQVQAALASKPGTRFHADTLETDVRALWKLGKFADIQIEGDASATDALALTIVVTERPAVGKAIVAGNHALGTAAVLATIDLGATLDLAAVQASRERLLALYRDEGFLSATARYTLVPAGKDRVDVRFEIDEKRRVSVRVLRFTGNHGPTAAELAATVQTRRGDTFHPAVFERDLLVLAAYYWDRGYANVKIGAPTQTLAADGRTIDIAIAIDEGPTFTIGKVHATGTLLDTEADTLRTLQVHAGTVFSRTMIATDREVIARRYQDDGYADASVLPLTKVDVVRRTIDLTFEVARGVVAHLDHITIVGNTTIAEAAIRNALAIREGDQFSETALETSKQHLQRMAGIDQVAVSTKHGGAADRVDVTIEITERAAP